MNNDRSFTNDLSPEDTKDSEWEYEYDETETESFYVTIDVSSNSHQTRAPKKAPQHGDTDTITPEKQQLQEGTQPDEALPVVPALQTLDPVPKGDKATLSASTDPSDRIQILDLHTTNPLISYNNRIYACTWGSTLDTDIFLTSPAALSVLPHDSQITPLKSLPDLSVLGTSCIKLTARPVTITPKTDNPQTQRSPQSPPINTQPPTNDCVIPPPQPTTTSTSALPSPTTHQLHPSNPLKIPLNPSAPNSTRKQASFLESLMAIKAAKGESDQVTVHATKSYQGYGWRSRRRLEEMAEAMDLEEQGAKDDENSHTGRGDPSSSKDAAIEQATSTQPTPSPAKRARTRASGLGSAPRRIGRPRRSRVRRAERTGGLFRDFVLDADDGGGSSTREADRTPVRWEDIEREVFGAVDGGGDKEGQDAGTAAEENTEKADSAGGEGEVDVAMHEGG
ncbi:MAG: hypothetical protein Q9225_002721 [Loekoesia sp. 1 TL-2023]